MKTDSRSRIIFPCGTNIASKKIKRRAEVNYGVGVQHRLFNLL